MEETVAAPTSLGLSRIAALPTGAKVFLILGLALFPLVVIALAATLQTTHAADQQVRARLRVAVDESAHALTSEIGGDIGTLRTVLGQLNTATRSDEIGICARAAGAFTQLRQSGVRFQVMGHGGRLVCGPALPEARQLAIAVDGSPSPRFVDDHGLVLGVRDRSGGGTASIFYPAAFLAHIAKPSGYAMPRQVELELPQDDLMLEPLAEGFGFGGREQMRERLGIDDLNLRMTVATAPITSPLVLALLLPIVMWLAAAAIAWSVTDRLLIQPLRDLRRAVAGYQPGELVETNTSAMPAQEIRELGETFRAISHTVQLHEAELAEGLTRQTKLTREVHHRVKNNLQVITSLINFHARGAPTREAAAAYASIQRRVDALAVVHRHHFAEMEDNRGLSLRAILGELASNIRATTPEDRTLGITLEVDPLHVSQDVAIAVAFLVTEIIELACSASQRTQVRVSAKPGETPDRAVLRVSSPGLVDSDELHTALRDRFGRVIEGLSRQLRSRLHHDPLVGAYEISVAIIPDA